MEPEPIFQLEPPLSEGDDRERDWWHINCHRDEADLYISDIIRVGKRYYKGEGHLRVLVTPLLLKCQGCGVMGRGYQKKWSPKK